LKIKSRCIEALVRTDADMRVLVLPSSSSADGSVETRSVACNSYGVLFLNPDFLQNENRYAV